ncbi:MAG: IPT/TIG domain-containing protein [Thermoanaerobaculia bacterium]|nr:IPT/TIG domain-containing protein [Thermoanaerobaculia bacterium]
MKASSRLKSILAAALLPFALFLVSCDADSPTAPTQQAQTPVTGGQATTWNITVTVSPNQFTIGDSQTTGFVTITATRASNGSRVPEGTKAVVSTSAGVLTAPNGVQGSSVAVEFDETGSARATISVEGFDSPGSVVVRAQLESSFGTANISIVETPDDTTGVFGLTQLTPTFGPPEGGTVVTVTGSNFEFPMNAALCRTSTVSTGSDCVAMTGVLIQSSTSFSAVTPRIDLPAGENLTVNLVVTKNSDFAQDAFLPNAFTYTRNSSGPTQLLLISVTPASGPNEGGTQVTIRGDGFNQEAQVFFSDGPLIEATVLEVTRTRILAITPSATGPNAGNANSIVDVVVRDPISGQQAELQDAFQYGRGPEGMFISAVGPNEVPYFGGIPVTIFGQGFDEPVAVEAGGVGQTPTSVTGTEVVFNASGVQLDSCSPATGPVSVTNIETGENANGPDFVYRPIEPVILSVDPASGPEGGGNTVVISGVSGGFRGFDPPVRVMIDGRLATVLSVSPDGSSVSVIAPQFTGTFQTEACTDGSGGSGERQLDTAVDIEVENTPTGCTDSATEAYIYRPADTTCQVTTVATGPTASFTTGIAGLVVTFTDTSTAGSSPITGWDWDFGDGGMSSSQNTSNVYGAAGPYTVTLTVTDSNGLTSMTSQDINL